MTTPSKCLKTALPSQPTPLSPTSPLPQQSFSSRASDFIFTVCGIYSCYLIYGYFQERIISQNPHATHPPFNQTLLLMMIQCSANFLLIAPFVEKSLTDENGKAVNAIPQKIYCLMSFTYLSGMLTSYAALNYINYPTTVLIKSCKMLPVMLVGALLYGKKYKVYEYVCVTMITIGIYFFFVYKNGKSDSASNTILGIVLSGVSLICDGLTGSTQDKYVAIYKPRSLTLMYETNKFAVFLVALPCILTGQFESGVRALSEQPSLLLDIGIFSIVSVLGQLFIFHCVTSFGALALSITTSTRKFFTILFSILWFQHHMSLQQWISVALVFSGLLLDIALKSYNQNQKRDALRHQKAK